MSNEVDPTQPAPPIAPITDLSPGDRASQLTVNSTRCSVLTGRAGTGKTTLIRQRAQIGLDGEPLGIDEDGEVEDVTVTPEVGVEPEHQGNYILAATTGIAAVNMGPGITTIHSLLGFYDKESMIDAHTSDRLAARVNRLIMEGYTKLVLEECSMFSKEQTDILVASLDAVNDYRGNQDRPNLDLVFVGDFCQLPPIKEPFAFEADCWDDRFAPNVERLTKVWRQEDEGFIQALNLARAGKGDECVAALRACGCWFDPNINSQFDGTTLMSTNRAVDNFNMVNHTRLPGKPHVLSSFRWMHKGIKAPKEWDKVPEKLELKDGAFVMVLANEPGTFSYVNGDQGVVNGPTQGGWKMSVKLKRTGEDVELGLVTRLVTQRHAPEDVMEQVKKDMKPFQYWPEGMPDGGAEMGRVGARPKQIHFDMKSERWVVGALTYFPLRLAYATTIHKSQGLTLDQVQIDTKARFFGNPAMAYVALSRCKSPGGLRLVGSPEGFAAKVKVAKEVLDWL